ncbi:hypothetical protein C2S51_030345 [Perilla frutescens var. frutescens]|nr:hypothetical protein C2S51_030345 [Perilla frutescens var. frutescens]
MDASKDVDTNMDEFNKLLQDLKLAGDDTHEKYAAQILLGAIPESFSEVKSALKYGGSKVTCNMIVTGLKAKENELKKLKSKPLHNEIMYVNRSNNRNPPHDFDKPPNPENPSVLAAERHRRDMQLGQNQHHNHAPNYAQNHTFDQKPRKTCWNCGKPGHFSNRCKMPKKNKVFGNYDHRANHVYEGANHVHEDTVNYDYYEGDGIYMVHTAYDCQFINYSNAVSKDMHENERLIDSGCTFHATPHKHMFHNLQYLNSGHVALADGQHCEIIGKGDICLKFENGSMLTLNDVRYVPKLKFSLLSVSKMADKMLEGSVNSLRFKFEKDSVLYFIAPRKGDLYVVHAESVPLPVANVIQEDKTALWHARLGHMSNKGLSILHKNGAFGKDKVPAIPFCEPCVMGEHQKIPLPVAMPYPRKHDFPCLSESSPYAAPSEVENLENLDNNLFDFMLAPPVAPSEVEDKMENATPMPSESENVSNNLPFTEHESDNHDVDESVSEHEANNEPRTYNEAVKSDESDKWLAVMNCEMKSLHDSNTRKLVEKWEVLFDKIPSEFNPMDMGTKCFRVAKLLSCKRSLNFDLG